MWQEALQYPLYLFYGLAFFSIGAAIFSKNLRISKLELAGPLIWLALFALTHAAHEWLELYLIIYEPAMPADLAIRLEILKFSLLATSFALLFWFGLRIAALNRFRWLKHAILGGVWFLVSIAWWLSGFDWDLEHLIRLYLCFPAGVKICVGFILYAQKVRPLSLNGGRNLAAAGVAMLIYATMAGLVPSRMVIYGEFIPVELLRMISSLIFLHFLMNALHIFDIEYLTIIEERLHRFAQSEKMTTVGKLAAGIAHEINTPLSNLLLNVERLEKGLETKPLHETRARLEAIKGNIDRASKIAKELLFFSRSQHPEFAPTDLNKVITKSVELVGSNQQNLSIKLILGDIPAIAGIPWKLEEVVVNLLVNAMDASPKGGSIVITSAYADNTVVCTIRDQGTGISPENREFVFDPFFTTKEPGKGTGLGLSICYRIMELHGGEIQIDSSPTYGTSVRLIFPLQSTDNEETR